MKKHFLVIWLVAFSVFSYGQTDQANYNDLLLQVSSLRNEINRMDSIEYFSTKNAILLALENDLEYNYNEVKDEIEKDKVFINIGKANNPTEKIFGVSYFDVLNQAVEKHLLSELPPKDRPRIQDILSVIINNPIATAVINSNPISATISSVVNSAAGFFNSEAVRKGKKIVIETKNLYSKEKLRVFNDELKPYVEFYDGLLSNSNAYLIETAALSNKHSNLNIATKDFRRNIFNSLGIQNNEKNIAASTLFEQHFPLSKNAYGYNDYRKILSDPRIIRAKKLADNFSSLRSQIRQFQIDYDMVLTNYFTATVATLNKAKRITNIAGFDQNQIDILIAEIQSYRPLPFMQYSPSSIPVYRDSYSPNYIKVWPGN